MDLDSYVMYSQCGPRIYLLCMVELRGSDKIKDHFFVWKAVMDLDFFFLLGLGVPKHMYWFLHITKDNMKISLFHKMSNKVT